MTVTLQSSFTLSNFRQFFFLEILLPKVALQFSGVLQFPLHAIETDRLIQRDTRGLGQ